MIPLLLRRKRVAVVGTIAVILFSAFVSFENVEINDRSLQTLRKPSKQQGVCNNEEPRHILQYGPARTATTLQYQILCVSMFAHLLERAEATGNYAMVEKYKCAFQKQFDDPDTPMVIKTHAKKQLLANSAKDVWVFVTASEKRNNTKQLQRRGYNICHVQNVESVAKSGHHILIDYAKFFYLSNERMAQILEFMSYWDILRVCCGAQMSQDWRHEMLPADKKNDTYVKHHSVHSPGYPDCHMHDIAAVETMFINTTMFRIMAAFPNMHEVLKPSTRDEAMDGTYCARYNDAVIQRGIGFNERLPVH